MLAPRPRRPQSRSSIATTLTNSSPPSSWSGMPRSSGTSATSIAGYSDEGTEMPTPRDLDDSDDLIELQKRGWKDEAPLIDFEEDVPPASKGTMEPRPTDRLKMLLKQMEMEVIDSTPVARTRVPEAREEVTDEEVKPEARWRAGRRLGLRREEQLREEVPSSPEHSPADDEELESPPTPPLRLSNPYSARTTDATASSSSSHRLPSRAAVLRNSGSSGHSASPAKTSVAPPTSKSPLQAFISNQNIPSYPSAEPSSSRSYDRSGSSGGSSRKGKERASYQEDSASHLPSRSSRFGGIARSPPRRQRSTTPRRQSVEIAPEDLAMFSQEAASLEAQGGLDLDLEDESDDPPWDADVEESHVEEPPPVNDDTVRNRPHRLDRILSRPSPSPPRHRPEDTSLPPLPEPSFSSEEEPANTVSSRQASLFRSPSKSVRHTIQTSPARPSPPPSRHPAARLDIAPPEPIRVGMAHVSTPTKGNVTLSTMPTPHPPGRWVSPARGAVPARSSPLTQVDSSLSVGDVSIHRLKMSPGKKASPRRNTSSREELPDDSSFLGRLPGLSRVLGNRPTIPHPSQAVQDAKEALASAAQSSSTARAHVEATQRQFLEALAAAQSVGGSAVAAVRHGWTWRSWAWWMSMEILLLWGVIRVSFEYASSAHHISHSDPFSLQANAQALSVPLPTAISTFIVPHRGSANFFDLLDRVDIWRRLDELGVLSTPGVVEGLRMLGGVPT